jgi:hypothetical protein
MVKRNCDGFRVDTGKLSSSRSFGLTDTTGTTQSSRASKSSSDAQLLVIERVNMGDKATC